MNCLFSNLLFFLGHQVGNFFKVSEQQQNRRTTVTAIGQIYRTLLQALAVLYQRTGQYPEALRILLKGGSIIGSPLGGSGASNIGATNYVFDIIQKRNLYGSMVNEVEYLLEFDKLVFATNVRLKSQCHLPPPLGLIGVGNERFPTVQVKPVGSDCLGLCELGAKLWNFKAMRKA